MDITEELEAEEARGAMSEVARLRADKAALLAALKERVEVACRRTCVPPTLHTAECDAARAAIARAERP